jgi:hypothetical protein
MKGSLFDIFQRHRDCYDFRKDPTIEEQQANPEARQLMAERFRERKQAASEYASSLIPLGNDWIEAVKHDVNKLATTLPPSLHFNKAEREAYRDGVEDFLLDVAAALREHGKGKFLNDEYFDPVTLYRFGIEYSRNEIRKGLSTENAEQMYKAMKQRYSQVYCFPDLFSMFPATYTVMGCKAKASTQAQAQKNAHSGTNSTGMGSNATTNPQTLPAAQETSTKPKRKPGRTAKEFEDFIVNSDEAENVLAIITKNIKPNNPAQAAFLICGAIEAGKLSRDVTAPSIERKFGVIAASIKPHLRKYRDGGYYKDKELKPYKDLFKA